MFRKRKKTPVFKKRRSLKPLFFAILGGLLLLALLIGGGIAYIYLTEPDETVEQEEFGPDRYNELSFETEEPDPDAVVGISVQMLTSPVAPGSNATYEVRTLRGAECDISVTYDETESQDSGLTPKTANNFGMASWTWTVEEWVPEGQWPVEVICSWNEQSGMLRSDIEVSYDTDIAE